MEQSELNFAKKKPGERRLAIELAGGLHVASWKDWVDSEVAWQEVNDHQEEQACPFTCALQYPLADADADADAEAEAEAEEQEKKKEK